MMNECSSKHSSTLSKMDSCDVMYKSFVVDELQHANPLVLPFKKKSSKTF